MRTNPRTNVLRERGRTGTPGLLSLSVSLFVWLVGFLTSSSEAILYLGRVPRLTTSDKFACCRTRDRARGGGGGGRDHGFCFSRSHYTDTDPTGRERASTAGVEPTTSSLEVSHSPGLSRSYYSRTDTRPSQRGTRHHLVGNRNWALLNNTLSPPPSVIYRDIKLYLWKVLPLIQWGYSRPRLRSNQRRQLRAQSLECWTYLRDVQSSTPAPATWDRVKSHLTRYTDDWLERL